MLEPSFREKTAKKLLLTFLYSLVSCCYLASVKGRVQQITETILTSGYEHQNLQVCLFGVSNLKKKIPLAT